MKKPSFISESKKAKRFLPIIASAVMFSAMAPSLWADYPITSHRYLADPAVLVTKDRVYLYCSNDDDSPVEGGYVIKNVVCVSSSDMKNWTDHGIVLDAEKDTTSAKKTWAPTPIERDGKFYLYFGNGGANIGVAVADNPAGPFKDAKGGKLIDSSTPGVMPAEHMWLFDPAVFIDDDGQAYMYFGGNGDNNVRVIKLNRDMISVDGPAIAITAPNFFEASWMHKRNGVYYFSYSTNPKGGMRIDYMTSDKPTSGFTYRGIIADQPPINNNNNHASEFQFKGQWYHVYHNRIVAKQAGIPTGFRRNLGIDLLNYNADGSIQKVTYTPDGVHQVGHINPYSRVEAETFNAQSGIKTQPCSEGGMNVCDIDNGDWIKIQGVDFGSKGARRFSARVASAEKGGSIELRLGNGKVIGTCPVGKGDGLQNWKTVTCNVAEATGVQDLYLVFAGGSAPLFNIDYWQFE